MQSNVSEADFVKWNAQREAYMQENRELWRQNSMLRHCVVVLQERLIKNGLNPEIVDEIIAPDSFD